MDGRISVSVRRVASFLIGALIAPSPASAQLPPWTRGATCYEVFVRSFQDSDGDGIGDLRGLIARLDYINDGNPRSTRDLGAGCIWLMPVAESPSYHGYDVADYYKVDRQYGTNEDFKRLVSEAHRRGIRVLVDMVINHVSSDHPFFGAALRDTASMYRAWFRWAPGPGPRNKWGGDNWHKSPLRNEYFYGFFWHGMPDWNYEHPAVLEEMKRVATFWLTEMDVDGFRLDAVKYLVEAGERLDDVPATHDVLREYARHVRFVKPQALTIGEVYDSTGALLPYYPDQLDAYFAFEVADSIIAAVRTGAARGLVAPALRLAREIPSQRWSPFLRNHDQPRTLTELGGDVARARVAATLLLTMPGMPFVYYGEELGMKGAKPDERIRTPMAWTRARHAGFTTGTPWQALQDDSLLANVAVQERDRRSILNLYRRLIHLRSAEPALGVGRLVGLRSSHDGVAAYARHEGDDVIVILANVGASTARDVTITAVGGAFPFTEGRRATRDLLLGGAGPPVTTDGRGTLQPLRIPVIPPMTVRLLKVARGVLR